jgi:hypothetical protein
MEQANKVHRDAVEVVVDKVGLTPGVQLMCPLAKSIFSAHITKKL